VTAILDGLGELSLPLRCAVVGAFCLGVLGAAVGLVVGLVVYAPTSPFAAVEVGLPAGVVGAVGGAAVGAALIGVRRLHSGRSGGARS